MRATPHWQADTDYHWTPRQREVLDLIARGRTNGEIAETLGVSLAGAKWHVSEVLSKLNAASREEAADYWRETNRLSRRVGHAFRALGGIPFLAKGIAGTASLGAFGALVVAGMAAFGGGQAAPVLSAAGLTTATATPTSISPTNGVDVPKCFDAPELHVATLDTADGPIELIARQLADGFCFGFTRPLTGETASLATSSLTSPALQGWTFSEGNVDGVHLALYTGTAPSAAHSIELVFRNGSRERHETFAAPAALDADVSFFAFELYAESLVDRIVAFDLNGNEIESQQIWGPERVPPYTSHPNVYPQISLHGDTDSLEGDILFGVPAAATALRFRVTHEGSSPLRILAWCNTGIVEPRYLEGPTDAGGSGVIALDVPSGNVACNMRPIRPTGAWSITPAP